MKCFQQSGPSSVPQLSLSWEAKKRLQLWMLSECCGKVLLTHGVDEGSVELLGEQRVRHVPQEFLQQCSHVMDTVLLIQLHVHTPIKLLPQLQQKVHIKAITLRWKRLNTDCESKHVASTSASAQINTLQYHHR